MSTMPLLFPTATVVRTKSGSPWRMALPHLTAPALTLREVHPRDASSLLSMLADEDVSRFISPPPTTLQSFERFIEWAIRERAAGGHMCYAVVPDGMASAVGIIQLRALDSGFDVMEWGFAIGAPFWGTGIFEKAAQLVIGFAFGAVGALRLEARAAASNGRGNGALRKLGAVQEGVLRRSFLRHGRYHDQILWSILAEDWKLRPSEGGPLVH